MPAWKCSCAENMGNVEESASQSIEKYRCSLSEWDPEDRLLADVRLRCFVAAASLSHMASEVLLIFTEVWIHREGKEKLSADTRRSLPGDWTRSCDQTPPLVPFGLEGIFRNTQPLWTPLNICALFFAPLFLERDAEAAAYQLEAVCRVEAQLLFSPEQVSNWAALLTYFDENCFCNKIT